MTEELSGLLKARMARFALEVIRVVRGLRGDFVERHGLVNEQRAGELLSEGNQIVAMLVASRKTAQANTV
jgi:hypothetical protein